MKIGVIIDYMLLAVINILVIKGVWSPMILILLFSGVNLMGNVALEPYLYTNPHTKQVTITEGGVFCVWVALLSKIAAVAAALWGLSIAF